MSKNKHKSDKHKKARPFPTREEILGFIDAADGKVSKREIARAFHIRGDDRALLKHLLAEMKSDGTLVQDAGRALRQPDDLPAVTVIEITGIDPYGDLTARAVKWEGDGDHLPIYLTPKRGRQFKPLAPGDRVLARLTKNRDADGPHYVANVVKVLENAPQSILGIYEGGESGGNIKPTDRKVRDEYFVSSADANGAEHGMLVLAKEVRDPAAKRFKRMKKAVVVECLGDLNAPKSISLIAIHHHGIPMDFPEDVLEQAKKATAAPIEGRTDLRDIPLVTIDPVDARDHDDAIFAEADTDPNNPGGWHIIIAIADVAHYVTTNSPIDKEARKRGNSCYFPDRVVPMLPEELSTDLCSLKPGVDRAAMACHIWLDKDGNKKRHKFERIIMRSDANISYQDVQAAIDGTQFTETSERLLEPVLKPLYGAWQALMAAREKRSPLELDVAERKIILSQAGQVEEIALRDRLDAHRVVEEYMIIANVAAAEELEKHQVPCMYRVHEEPPMDKVEHLREFLKTLDISLAKGQVLRPALFNNILAKVKDKPIADLVNTVVLRTQTQAYYSPENQGHFGLALQKYAHFTSPIRRYSDLLVHRGLVKALKLGNDGLTDEQAEKMSFIGEEISKTERRAMAAERESNDRYLAAFLADKVDQDFKGRISGVTRFGLFITLNHSAADGFVPMASLFGDFYEHDEKNHQLVGKRFGNTFQLGQEVEVKLVDVDKTTGSLRLEMQNLPFSGGHKGKRSKSRRPQKGTPKKGNVRRRGKRQ